MGDKYLTSLSFCLLAPPIDPHWPDLQEPRDTPLRSASGAQSRQRKDPSPPHAWGPQPRLHQPALE